MTLNPIGSRVYIVAGMLGLLTSAVDLHAANAYIEHKIISNTAGQADHTDPGLLNPWGIAESATSPFWFSDNGSGLSTLYSTAGDGSIPGLIVNIASSAAGGQAKPTGIVAYGGTGFEVTTGNPAGFIFDGLDGTITGWAFAVDKTHALVKVDNSAKGAVYTGLAIGTNGTNTYLFAANFNSAAVEVYDSTWAPVTTLATGAFTDPMIPSGYAPYNIQSLNGNLYVTYAKQDSAKQQAVAGPGNGYLDVYDTAGTLKQHLISTGPLNAPWGIAIAPAGFGDYANDLLVGNFGDGWINVFNPTTGAFIVALNDTSGNPIAIPGLWALQPGNGASGGDKNAVYFTAGPSLTQGLFGSLQAGPAIASTGGIVNGASFQPNVAPNTFISIIGENLSSTTRIWAASDFVNGALPTTLDGVSVMVDNKPAYVYYISPTQLNVLTPADTTQGAVPVQTKTNGLSSGSGSTQLQAVAPAFFLFQGGKYIAATHANGSYIGPTTLFPNASTPAKPGETIVLYGNGFGPTTPPAPNGQILSAPLNLTTMPVIMFGNTQGQVTFAGLTGAGLFQINVVVPTSTGSGDITVVAQAGGQSSPPALITVQQ